MASVTLEGEEGTGSRWEHVTQSGVPRSKQVLSTGWILTRQGCGNHILPRGSQGADAPLQGEVRAPGVQGPPPELSWRPSAQGLGRLTQPSDVNRLCHQGPAATRQDCACRGKPPPPQTAVTPSSLPSHRNARLWMETVSSKKHSMFSLVCALGTRGEQPSTRPFAYLGGCWAEGHPCQSCPHSSGAWPLQSHSLYHLPGKPGGTSLGLGSRGKEFARKRGHPPPSPVDQALSLTGRYSGRQMGCHKHSPLSLRLPLHTMGSLKALNLGSGGLPCGPNGGKGESVKDRAAASLPPPLPHCPSEMPPT